jgi:hypothetical protein
MKNNRQHIFTITLAFTLALVTLFLLAVFNGWLGEWSHTGDDFCEASRPGIIKQPANTWSNIGFIIAGLTIAWQLSRNRFSHTQNVFNQSNFTATFFSCMAVFLGPASMAMHATETRLGGFLDMLSMYLIAGFAASYAMQRFFKYSSLVFTVVFSAIVLFCVFTQHLPYELPLVGFFGNFLFGCFIAVTIVFESLNSFVRKYDHEIKWGIFSLVSLLVAFLIWNLERRVDAFCNPHSLIQGHAFWHLLDALSVYFLFRFYVSEHNE